MSIISIHVTAEKLSEFLESYRKKAENLTPVMKGIAEELHSETMLNFEQQGHPRWPDLSAVTRRIRAERNQDPNGPILKVSGQLRNSIMASSDTSTTILTARENTFSDRIQICTLQYQSFCHFKIWFFSTEYISSSP